VAKEAELEEREAEYIWQLNEKVIDAQRFRELIELDMERVMGESITEGLATMQDEEIGGASGRCWWRKNRQQQ
jgi:hypothetical protein